jgi:hypothetical protein
MKGYYLLLGIILGLTACRTSKNKGGQEQTLSPEEFLIVGDIDTAKTISQLAIKESGARFDLAHEKIGSLAERLDTLELTYYFGFCDCQQWIRTEIYNTALGAHSDLGKLDSRGQIQFDLDEHGYYIEPADVELEINWRAEVNGTTIRLIGREYKDKRLPKGGGFTVLDPPKGKVFRYYNYQILRPYRIWGPHKLADVNNETGDSIIEPTILIVH